MKASFGILLALLLGASGAQAGALKATGKSNVKTKEEKASLALETGQMEVPVDQTSLTLHFPITHLKKNPDALPRLEVALVRHAGFIRSELEPAFSAPAIND